MTTHGIDTVLIETHNWGKSVAFWQALGYVLEFETDHHSGQLRHPSGGPALFIAERPASQPLQVQLGIRVDAAARFEPPPAGRVARKFTKQHWGVQQMLLADPDGRLLGVAAPLAKRPARKGKGKGKGKA